jgi:hypothetical protein
MGASRIVLSSSHSPSCVDAPLVREGSPSIRVAARMDENGCQVRRIPLGAAVGAEAGDLDLVRRRREVGRRGHPLEPVVEAAVGQLDHAVAAGADEVMVVLVAADPVAALLGAVREDVDDALLGQDAERAVDGREADALAAVAEPAEKLLGGRVVRLPGELLEHPQPLSGRPEPRRDEPLPQDVRLHLTRGRHGA